LACPDQDHLLTCNAAEGQSRCRFHINSWTPSDGILLTSSSDMDRTHWKMKLTVVAVYFCCTTAQNSDSSQPFLSANSLENGPSPVSFHSLLGRLTRGPDTSKNSILTSVSTPSRSIGNLGSSLGLSSNGGSRTSVSSSALPLAPQLPIPSFDLDYEDLTDLPLSSSLPFAPSPSDPTALASSPTENDSNVFLELEFPQADNAAPNVQEEETRSSVDTADSSHLSLEQMSSLLPSLIEAMSDPSASKSEISAVNSLVSSMVKIARQQTQPSVIPGGVDFSQATRTEDGRLCVIKEDSVESVSKDPILECTHKNVEKCHYTYITQFNPTQEEECEENFEKSCQITFRQEASSDTVRKCYRPQKKVCNGQGPEECRTVYESSCTTKYIEKTPGKFVGDTKCEKQPVEICGQGCVVEEGEEECHDKQVDTLVDIPEEICDLNPQKTCRLVTRLVPSLKPERECTIVPKETCNLKFSQPKVERKPLRTEWCLDESPTQTQAPREEDFGINQPLPVVTQAPGNDFLFPEDVSVDPVESAPSNYRANLIAELKRLKRLGIV